MEAVQSCEEPIGHISCLIRRTFALSPHLPPVISQNYKITSCIAQHEGIPQPVGTLYTFHREHELLLSTGVGGESTQEKTLNDGRHTVLTSYGGHACERNFSLSTSHSLGLRSCMKLYYEGSSRGDSFCSIQACHSFNEETIISSSYAEGVSSDPSFDIELQQEKKFYKVMGKLARNLTNGLYFLNMQSRAALSAKLTLKNTISTDLQGNGYSGIEASWASRGSSLLTRAVLGMDGNRECSLQGSQRFWKSTHTTVSASTNLHAETTLSLKLEHKLSKENEISMNVTSDCARIQEASIIISFAKGGRLWKWKYRKAVNDGHLLGLEWQNRGNSDGICSLNIEAGHHGFYVNGDFRHLF